MKFNLKYLVLLFICIFMMQGCVEEENSRKTPEKATVAPKPAPSPEPEAPKVLEKQPEQMVYVSEGRRDPFIPLSAIRTPLDKPEPSEPETPLQSYDVAQFRLIGVIVGKGAPKAMVVAPDGKSYILARGVKIGKNNGVVLDITSKSVSVKEKYYDFSGNVIENIQEIFVPIREGV